MTGANALRAKRARSSATSSVVIASLFVILADVMLAKLIIVLFK